MTGQEPEYYRLGDNFCLVADISIGNEMLFQYKTFMFLILIFFMILKINSAEFFINVVLLCFEN